MTSPERRDFLKQTLKLTAGLALAFNYGCTLRSEINRRGAKKIAILYATKYGATSDTTEWIAKGIGGDVALLDITQPEVSAALAGYDLFIIGSGVWIGDVHEGVRAFTKKHAEQLQEKLLAVFIVCGTEPTSEAGRKRIEGYLQPHASPHLYEAKYFRKRAMFEYEFRKTIH